MYKYQPQFNQLMIIVMIILGSLNFYTPNHKYQPQYDQVMIVIIIILRPLNFYTSRWVWWQWSCCNWETALITRFMAQHGAHLGPTGPRWAPCWPHAPCYLSNLENWYHLKEYHLPRLQSTHLSNMVLSSFSSQTTRPCAYIYAKMWERITPNSTNRGLLFFLRKNTLHYIIVRYIPVLFSTDWQFILIR